MHMLNEFFNLIYRKYIQVHSYNGLELKVILQHNLLFFILMKVF